MKISTASNYIGIHFAEIWEYLNSTIQLFSLSHSVKTREFAVKFAQIKSIQIQRIRSESGLLLAAQNVLHSNGSPLFVIFHNRRPFMQLEY